MFTALVVAGSLYLAQANSDYSSASAAIQNRIETRVENRETFRENVREAIDTAREARTQIREEFRERLRLIVDNRKQQIVENIDSRIPTLNEKWVTHWGNVLDRLETLVDKMATRLDDQTLADSAREAIATARASVAGQAEKVYMIEITDESALGANVSATIAEFHADIRTVVADVNSAREAVVSLLNTLKLSNN